MQHQNRQCFCLNTPVLKSSLCVSRLGDPKERGFFCPPLGVKRNPSSITYDHTSWAVSWNWPVAVGSDLHHHGDPAALSGYSSYHSHQAHAYNPCIYWKLRLHRGLPDRNVPVGQASWSNSLPILGSTSGEAEPPLEAFSFTTCQQKEPQGLA